MRMIVSHVYSRKNRGDSAILSCQLKELQRVLPGVELEVLTLENIAEHELFDGIKLHRSLMSMVVGTGAPRALRPLLGVSMMASTTAWAITMRLLGVSLPMPRRWRAPLALLRDCDAQVCVGGGYIRANKSLHSTYILALLVHQIVLASLLRKPVYLYAQSFGPFPGRSQRLLFQAAVRCASLVLPRESISLAAAQRAGGNAAQLARVIDTAFLVQRAPPADLTRWFPGGRPETVVGITAREWLQGESQHRYEEGLRELVAHILNRGWGVLIVPQVTATDRSDDDRVVGRRLGTSFNDHPHFASIEDDLSLEEILGVYSALDYLVGTRFHSVIFSLSAQVPCVAIEYEHKTSGILNDLGLGEWWLRIEDVTGAALISALDKLVTQRQPVTEQIRGAVELARTKANVGANLIADHFRSLQA